jgi:hypothetical protein
MNPLGSVIDIIPGTPPKDTGTSAPGDYINLTNHHGVLVVYYKGIGTAGEDPTIELQQATSAAGAGAKDLNGFAEIHKKQGTDLTTVGTWTRVSQTADEDFVGDATSAESQGLYTAWVPTTALDVANGFKYLCVNIKDTGVAAQLGCVLYIVHGFRYGGAPTRLGSAIV